jgi:hypothetical protein
VQTKRDWIPELFSERDAPFNLEEDQIETPWGRFASYSIYLFMQLSTPVTAKVVMRNSGSIIDDGQLISIIFDYPLNC